MDAARQIARLQSELAHATRVSMTGRLTASLIHELSQPLTAILANTGAAVRIVESSGDSDLCEMLADTHRMSEQARNIINRLRTFLRKGENVRAPVDINMVVQELMPSIRAELSARKVHLTLRLHPRLPAILADRVQIEQVIMNLLLNAADAVASNCVGCRDVTIRTLRHEKQVELLIEDNGIGFQCADLRLVFEPFVSTKQHGMGIGMAICRDIVNGHGGQITARNLTEGGASLQVFLPLFKGAQEERSIPIERSERRVILESHRLTSDLMINTLQTAITLLDMSLLHGNETRIANHRAMALRVLGRAERRLPTIALFPEKFETVQQLRSELQMRLAQIDVPTTDQASAPVPD